MWSGPTKLVFETGYAITIGIHNGGTMDEGHFLHSECTASRRGDTDIEFTTTLPVDEVASITSSQNSLTTSSLVSNIAVASTQAVTDGLVTQSEVAEVTVPTAAALTVAAPVSSTFTVHGVAPTAWSTASDIQTKTATVVTVSGAFGLDLAPDKDAAKVVSHDEDCAAAAPGGGTTEATDLGPGDTDGAQTAQLELTFTVSGLYKLCYRPFGEAYVMVGTKLLPVYGAGPVIQAYFPAQGGSAIAPNANIVISFDISLQLGSSGFVNLSTPAMAAMLIPVPDAQVSVSSNTMTINPTANLNTQGATYTVNIDPGVVTDGTNNFQGLNGSEYQFTVVSQIHAMFTLSGSIEDFGSVYPGVAGGRYSPLVLSLASAVSLGPSNVTVAKVKSGSVIAITTFSIDQTKSSHGLSSLNASLHGLHGKSIAGDE